MGNFLDPAPKAGSTKEPINWSFVIIPAEAGGS